MLGVDWVVRETMGVGLLRLGRFRRKLWIELIYNDHDYVNNIAHWQRYISFGDIGIMMMPMWYCWGVRFGLGDKRGLS